ncbi:MAG: ABC transporter substrate-binding protein [Candidatus Bipolaricaulis sp.]|nr:ABC transporter substrate-binding protein [Candidatus Bipolaricaulis sp.]
MSRRSAWWFVGLVLSLTVAFALSGAAAADKIVFLFYGEPGEADPATAYDARSSILINNVYDRLLTYEGESASTFAPMLAESWEVSEGGSVLTFHLVKNATFHDGSPVTAEAVRYSFNRVMTMNQPPSWMLSQMMNQDSVVAVDDYTVRINLTSPYAAALGVLTHTVASIVNPAVIEANGGVVADQENTWLNQNEGGAGSGPYVLKEWIPAERLTFERYDAYWGEKAITKTIECPIVLEVGTRVLMLRTGDADLHDHFPESNVPDLQGQPNVTILSPATFDIDFIALGHRGPMAEQAVRQAVSYAFPYDDVIQYVYNGYAIRSTGPIPSGMFGYVDPAPEKMYTHDIDKANAILDAAGWTWASGRPGVGYRTKDGVKLGMDALVPSGEEVKMQEALLFQSNLTKIGFNLRISEIAYAMMYRTVRNHETDSIFTGWLPDYADPDNYVDAILATWNCDPIWGASYSNPTMDALITAAKSEVDVAKRADLYKQIQDLSFEDAPFVWVAQRSNITILNNSIKGYYYNPILPINFAALSKEG